MTTQAQRVRDFMKTDLISVTPETEIMRAVHLLVSEDVSGLPVVDEQGMLLGIVTERDCIVSAWSAIAFFWTILGARLDSGL